MNEAHLQILASPQWARTLREDLLPWLIQAGELGDDVLELGPGPGLTTDLLMQRTAWVTAVEVDEHLAAGLAGRMAGMNVTVIHADASRGRPSSRSFLDGCVPVDAPPRAVGAVAGSGTSRSLPGATPRRLLPGGRCRRLRPDAGTARR